MHLAYSTHLHNEGCPGGPAKGEGGIIPLAPLFFFPRQSVSSVFGVE